MSEKVDVLIPTFNNSRTLTTCLRHIREAIPYNKILVGDGGSRDGTVDIANSMGAKVYSFTGKDNMIGAVRYKLAERAETEWVLYIDSDTYVYPTYWKIVSMHKEGAGMVIAKQDRCRLPNGEQGKYYEWAIKRLGFTTFSNTLVLRALILECKELLKTNACEDTIQELFAKNRGFRIVKIYHPLSYHDKPLYSVRNSYKRRGKDSGKTRKISSLLWREAFHLRNLAWFFVEERVNGIEFSEQCRYAWEIYKGYIEGLKEPI
jgi:glycosyltransferase involved in cell wall biosynthesis